VAGEQLRVAHLLVADELADSFGQDRAEVLKILNSLRGTKNELKYTQEDIVKWTFLSLSSLRPWTVDLRKKGNISRQPDM
jgi:hypothetical protein